MHFSLTRQNAQIENWNIEKTTGSAMRPKETENSFVYYRVSDAYLCLFHPNTIISNDFMPS